MSDSQTRILLATDGSKASFHAAERAVHLAGHLGAKLYVLYAVDKDRAFHAGIHYGEDTQELRRQARRRPRRWLHWPQSMAWKARNTSSKVGGPRGPSSGRPKRSGPIT